MSEARAGLEGASVLVLEDDYYLATDLQKALERSGATVIGPFSDAAEASEMLGGERPDCAFVDVNLGEGPSFELPFELKRLAIPFAFVTGYDAKTIPDQLCSTPRLEKPVEAHRVVSVALELLNPSGARLT